MLRPFCLPLPHHHRGPQLGTRLHPFSPIPRPTVALDTFLVGVPLWLPPSGVVQPQDTAPVQLQLPALQHVLVFSLQEVDDGVGHRMVREVRLAGLQQRVLAPWFVVRVKKRCKQVKVCWSMFRMHPQTSALKPTDNSNGKTNPMAGTASSLQS